MKLVALTLLLAMLAGCGGGASSQGSGVGVDSPDARDLDAWFLEIEADKASLASVLSSVPVDCARACDVRAGMGNLARRICSVTKELELERDRQVQCVVARRRSEIARADVKQVCECAK